MKESNHSENNFPGGQRRHAPPPMRPPRFENGDIKKNRRHFFLHYMLLEFIIIFNSSFVMALIAYILIVTGVIDSATPPFMLFLSLIGLLVISVFIGVAFTLAGGKRAVSPITELSDALVKLMNGDFTVTLKEDVRGPEEIRELRRNFNKLVRISQGGVRLLDDLMVNISHEFKTPIAAIEGYAALLETGDLCDSERNEYITMIRDSANRLSRLSNNILNLSKLEKQEIVSEKREFSMDELMRQSLLMLEAQWSQKEIELDLQLNEVMYNGNADMLGQVFTNLFSNAVKFTQKSGLITATLKEDEKSVTAVISDNGEGMDEATRLRIFEKFYQGESAQKNEGNGLGLALVRRIVDLCGGKIEVASEMGKGSTFTLTLPKSIKD